MGSYELTLRLWGHPQCRHQLNTALFRANSAQALARVRVRVTLRLADCQPFCHGIDPCLGSWPDAYGMAWHLVSFSFSAPFDEGAGLAFSWVTVFSVFSPLNTIYTRIQSSNLFTLFILIYLNIYTLVYTTLRQSRLCTANPVNLI
jgi:hypothetical protein